MLHVPGLPHFSSMALGTTLAGLLVAKLVKGGTVAAACKCASVAVVAGSPAGVGVLLGVMTGCVVTMSATALTALIVRA